MIFGTRLVTGFIQGYVIAVAPDIPRAEDFDQRFELLACVFQAGVDVAFEVERPRTRQAIAVEIGVFITWIVSQIRAGSARGDSAQLCCDEGGRERPPQRYNAPRSHNSTARNW